MPIFLNKFSANIDKSIGSVDDSIPKKDSMPHGLKINFISYCLNIEELTKSVDKNMSNCFAASTQRCVRVFWKYFNHKDTH